ncbi:hypothetical protein SODALDRAFT_72361 [Sodiomyces alkalinus F11]|uniref:Ribonuclease H2 subunit B n=1 Tax=Sodiomyces alkalinus (strain CBS 110278 / VKM F-3762 / F11) TaxID=1314773 RepID=A0A3N2PK05_SODAK|nr:hypothetical protein SODALDRAFT_72361 [Sodiomyces alkalinus F11]ROT34857.1 hypothetical protein SODALDRAFT_72361 [Sodiomyces alkalinus F11]
MARTRSTKAASAANGDQSQPVATKSKYSPPVDSNEPSRVFILPTKATSAARIILLLNPRYSKPTKYLLCPESGLYEFTQIAAPKTTPRSWLIERKPAATEEAEVQAQITNGADLFIATPVDPLFVVLPALTSSTASKSDDGKRLFLTSEDHFDSLSDSASTHFSEVLRCEKTRTLFEARMGAICDTVEAGDEKMFRLNEKKLIEQILLKAKALGSTPLPPSMEDKFVKKVLEAPLSVQKSDVIKTETKEGHDAPSLESVESQSSVSTVDSATTVDSTSSLASAASTAATSVSGDAVEDSVSTAMKASDDVVALQRLKVAFSFICSGHVSPTTATRLEGLLKERNMSGVDFAPLEAYLTELAKLRAEAASARSMADYSGKRHLDDEAEEARAEKKRKLEEEKKRKASASRGVRELKKVNTSGMKKMSDFFKKK